MNLLLELLTLNERRYGVRDWVILPATMALYGRRTVDIITAASEWKDSEDTILVCKKPDEKNRFAFISSSGNAYDSYVKDIGKEFHGVHDQSGASKGMYKLVNVVVLKNDKIIKSANDEGLKAKASLSVFK